MKSTNLILYPVLILLCLSFKGDHKPFRTRLQPISPDSGFKMEDYWVWCGSVIKVGNTYHLFASRWPKKNKFPDDYFVESEIVRATASSPMGPYTFREVIIGERDSSFWDSNMAHNPTIHQIGNRYVLFYIGSDFNTLRPESKKLLRRVGYATASSIEGPWERCARPVIEEESNNPALLVEPDHSVKLMYRDEKLKVKLAVASDFRGPYTVANANVWPDAPLEDFYLFKKDGRYHFICEDNVGQVTGHVRWGAHLSSPDGINNWHPFDPVVAYNHDLIMENGSVLHCVRRERPQLLIEDHQITHLFTSVYDGQRSWCQPQALVPAMRLDIGY